MADENSFTSQGFLSQGTLNHMWETIAKNTPPEAPVTRTKKEHNIESDISVTIPGSSIVTKNIKDRYTVADFKGRKLVYVPRDAQFRVDLSYTKYCTTDLFVRIYPSSSDCAFKNLPITSCSTHGVKVLTKVSADSLEKAMKSIFEVHDPDVEYQYIDLGRNEVQVSALARFYGPDIGFHLTLKCYNSCQKSFKKIYPKLHFVMERCVAPNKYLVLSETAIYFKVCASPARDCKSMTLKKRPLSLNNGSQSHETNQPSSKLPKFAQPVTNVNELSFIELNEKKFRFRLVSDEIWKIVETIQKYGGPLWDADTRRKLDQVEALMSNFLSSTVSDQNPVVEKREPDNNTDI